MRGVVVLALIAALAVTASASGDPSASTSLRIAFWEGGAAGGAPDVVWTLRCNPARGSLARPARACSRLAAGGAKLFAPTRPDTACTEIYGGPQRARTVGTVGGTHVWTTFTRTNGCEINRWARVSPWLLPSGGVR